MEYLLQRNTDYKFTALTRAAFHADLSAVSSYEIARDRQAQAHSLLDAPAGVAAIKRQEDFFALLFVDSRAGIPRFKHKCLFICRCRNFHGSARRRIFDGITDEISHHLG